MPYTKTHVPPQIALEYGGVVVYHAYKYEDIEERMTFAFTLDVDENENNVFDVRELRLQGAEDIDSEDDKILDLLRKAVDAGLLTQSPPAP